MNMKPLKVLITSGGTSEPIDQVRVITNKSTGRTGAIIADYFLDNGCEVTYLGSKRGFKPKHPCSSFDFTTFKSLQDLLQRELQSHEYDLVIHSAAVSDFSVIPVEGKLSSDTPPELKFTKNPKLVDSLKTWSKNKLIKIVAFKLTAQATPEERQQAVDKLLSRSGANFVVLNDITEISPEGHLCQIKDHEGKTISQASSKESLAEKLWEVLS